MRALTFSLPLLFFYSFSDLSQLRCCSTPWCFFLYVLYILKIDWYLTVYNSTLIHCPLDSVCYAICCLMVHFPGIQSYFEFCLYFCPYWNSNDDLEACAKILVCVGQTVGVLWGVIYSPCFVFMSGLDRCQYRCKLSCPCSKGPGHWREQEERTFFFLFCFQLIPVLICTLCPQSHKTFYLAFLFLCEMVYHVF